MVETLLLLQQIINGLLFGGQLALVAIGLTLIWGVTRILNFAHGAMFMLGGYAGFFAYEFTGSLLVAIPVAALALFVIGVGTEVLVVRQLRDRDNTEIAAIIGTFAIAVIAENLMRYLYQTDRRSIPTLTTGIWQFDQIILIKEQVLMFTLALVSLGVLFAVIRYTKLGMAMRAVAQDTDTARLMGIRSDRIYALTFGVSAALAGLAGVLLSNTYSIYPGVGWRPFLFAFIVVIIGGLGSVRGTLLAALFIGVFRSLSLTFISSQQAEMLLFLVMIAILIVRPTGIGGVIDS
ncbi:branched-chain amino acid ABC transporter permease [Natronosalvus rutilus]|uniref:Branched-chain amino acid ABC transporter permease n=1 Tax=Natronosalvus rutilus TaxID=2953753 RepID=A0A9E7SX01_9EURY|nr:branched-chain amino acid ABC transporter permease [Natronosalvus rutilus]UTF55662.1 branched-chain amino acid ABC transporter permease [Natronosalvus rutilus]